MSALRSARRFAVVVLVALMAATLLGGCSTNRGDKDVVRKAIARTRLLSRKFVYQEKPLGLDPVEVDGLVEDDFRYAADLKIGGQLVRQEVASDDALAVRFPDGSLARRFLETNNLAAAAPHPGDLPTPQVLGVLEAGQWVQDSVGAPSLVVAANDKRKLGDDEIYDSLTLFDYLDKAVQASPNVKKFDPDSLNPTFKTKEDPFPKPSRGAPIVRYDLGEAPLPKAGNAGGASKAVLPDVTNFRKLAIYVKDGVIVRVMEVVDVKSKLEDLKRNFKITDDITVEQAVEGLNKVRRFAGQDPIRVRQMTFELQDLGAPQHVQLPQGAAPGNLAVVKFRGKQATPAATVPTSSGDGGQAGGGAPQAAGTPGGADQPSQPSGA